MPATIFALCFLAQRIKKKIPPERQNTSAHIMRKIYTNCHSAGNYLKVSTAVLNQALPFCACNYFRALYQLYLLNSPKLFNKFTMVNADTT
jgi:hypothetical protein